MPSFVRRCVRRLICVSFGMIQPFNKSAFRQIKQHSFGYFVALTECKACQVSFDLSVWLSIRWTCGVFIDIFGMHRLKFFWAIQMTRESFLTLRWAQTTLVIASWEKWKTNIEKSRNVQRYWFFCGVICRSYLPLIRANEIKKKKPLLSIINTYKRKVILKEDQREWEKERDCFYIYSRYWSPSRLIKCVIAQKERQAKWVRQ